MTPLTPRSITSAGSSLAVALFVLGAATAHATTDPPSLGAGGGPSTPGSVSGAAASGAGGCPPSCDDGNACTDDMCDDQYQCVHTPIQCDDGLNCTDDSCNELTGCVNAQKDCSTGSVCIAMACRESTGTCVTVNKLLCRDRNACTDDICDHEIGCMHVPVWCNDHDPCTRDACDPSGGCTFVAGECRPPGHSSPPGAAGGAPSIVSSRRGDARDGSDPQPAPDAGAGTVSVADLRDGSRALAGACGAPTSPIEHRRAEQALARLLSAGWMVGPDAAVARSAAWDLAGRTLAAALGDDAACVGSIAGQSALP